MYVKLCCASECSRWHGGDYGIQGGGGVARTETCNPEPISEKAVLFFSGSQSSGVYSRIHGLGNSTNVKFFLLCIKTMTQFGHFYDNTRGDAMTRSGYLCDNTRGDIDKGVGYADVASYSCLVPHTHCVTHTDTDTTHTHTAGMYSCLVCDHELGF